MSRNNKHTEIAFRQLVAYGRGRDILPYSEHFESMYEEFLGHLGYRPWGNGMWLGSGDPDEKPPPSRRDYWLTLAAAAKKGGLQEARRVKPVVGEAYQDCVGQAKMFDNQESEVVKATED